MSQHDEAMAGSMGGSEANGGATASEELVQLRESYAQLLEEAAYHKRVAQQLERENKRLQEAAKYVRKSKKQLTQQLQSLEAELQKERRERAAMEVSLSEAYSQTLREIVASHASERATASDNGDMATARPGARQLLGRLNFR